MEVLKLTSPMMHSKDILAVQRTLKAAGIYKGHLDGIFGRQTENAVKNFQQQKGISADGIVGSDTLKALGTLVNTSAPQTDHFKMSEFRCKDGTDVPMEYWSNLQRLMNMLEGIRTQAGNRQIYIVSGYRTPSYNAQVGGAKASQHMYAAAGDIQIQDMNQKAVYDLCDKFVGNKGGVGRYDDFTHVDVRGYKARW